MMLVICGLTAMLVGWYSVTFIREQNRLFLGERRMLSRLVMAQADTVLVRVKDLAAFISARREEQVAAKLRVASRLSPYIIDLGLIRGDSLRQRRSFTSPDVLLDVNPVEAQRLAAQLLQNEGLITAIRPQAFASLFPNMDGDEVVLAQAMRLGEGPADFFIVYAAVEVRKMLEELSADFREGSLTAARLTVDEVQTEFILPGRGTADWTGDATQEAVRLAHNSQIVLANWDRTVRFGKLAFMVAGILAISAITVALSVHYMRDRRRAEAELQAALDKANSANDSKSTFLANMSHEIRTPLNGVLGMAELLTRTELSEQQLRYVRQIRSSGGVLLSILNDILDISKLESGQMAIDPVRVNLPGLISDIVGFYAMGAQDKELDLLLDIEPDLPEFVQADPTRLRQIIGNLISNALKFTKQGEIFVSAAVESHDDKTGQALIRVSIRDSGIGISEQSMAKLFSRFTQAEASTTRLYGGTGLGLSICRELCELMGGHIGVTSAIGQGSTFTFRLPVQVLQPATIEKGPALRLAIICGAPPLKSIIGKGLEVRGVECVWFEPTVTLQRALQAQAENAPFDALVIDQGPHIEEALEVRRLAQAFPALSAAPTIVLGTQQADKRYAAFSQVVIKPFSAHTLYETILRVVQSGISKAEGMDMAGASSISPAHPFEGYKALLVDDNNVNLMFGEEILRDLGFEVARATNGKKAIEAALQGRFDVIFMDCQMPVMDGYEASGHLRRMMADGEIHRVPIVALTANALKGDREKCLAAGMDAFLSKPISTVDLQMLLDSLKDFTSTAAKKQRVLAAVKIPSHSPTATVKAPLPGSLEQDLAAELPGTTTASFRPSAAPKAQSPVTIEAPLLKGSSENPAPATSPKAAPGMAAPTAEQPPLPRSKIPVIDLAEFQKTKSSMKKFEVLISFYLQDTSSYIEDIKKALAMAQVEDAIMPAHTIKSSSRILGASALALLAEEFEKRARLGGEAQMRELQAIRDHMERVFTATSDGIKKLMDDGKGIAAV
ncbi:hybrid sensor histidine kinase/response regulator [Teichococcus aestuarii]|uniref:hybrid sensor histidine kinase/response regulator n=3 Tax=Teichococcus aestuarii TaxID=568898 RepID=UPI00360A1640